MNKYIKSAQKKLFEIAKAETVDEQNACIFSVANDIITAISFAVFPAPEYMLPFIAAVFSEYNDLLNSQMNTEQRMICDDAKRLLQKYGKPIKFRSPRKD